MKKIKIIGISFLILLTMMGCKKDEAEVTPSGITDIAAESLPGEIKITWTKETPVNFQYIKVSYFDKLLNKNVVRLASKEAEGITIPDTRAKFGEYKFTLQSYSSTNTGGKEYQIEAVSQAAPPSYTIEPIELKLEQLSTNAQEPKEGPIANLLDGDINTFFHTKWSGSALSEMHYFQVKLNEPVSGIKFDFGTRHNSKGGDIKRMKILVSNDGTDWTEITEESFDLKDQAGQMYSSGNILFKGDYQFIRFLPTARRSADPLVNSWFNLSIFRLYKVTEYDPEA